MPLFGNILRYAERTAGRIPDATARGAATTSGASCVAACGTLPRSSELLRNSLTKLGQLRPG